MSVSNWKYFPLKLFIWSQSDGVREARRLLIIAVRAVHLIGRFYFANIALEPLIDFTTSFDTLLKIISQAAVLALHALYQF